MRTLLALLVLAPCAHAQEPALKPMLFPIPARNAAKAPKIDLATELARLSDKDAAKRKSAIVALGEADNVRAVPELGARLLDLNEVLENRVAAATALGRVRNWRSNAYLKLGAKDAAKEVRFASVLALGKTKSDDSLPALTEALSTDLDWWVRFGAAVSLGDDRDPKSVAALEKSAHDDSEWQVRMQAVRSLGQLGSRDAILALDKPLHDPDASVRAASAMALGDIGGSLSRQILGDALKTERDAFAKQVISDAFVRLMMKP